MTPLEVVGAIVAVLVALGLCAAGFAYAFDVIWGLWRSMVAKAVTAHLRERGRQMHYQASWFTDINLAAMWQCCADTMMDGGYPEAREVRDIQMPVAVRRITEARSK